MNKKYLIGFLSLLVLIPNLAFASWWNPLSWVKNVRNKEVKTTLPITRDSDVATSSPSEVVLLKKEIEELKKEARANKEKVVTPKQSTQTVSQPQAVVPVVIPTKTVTSDPVRDYEISQIIKYCNMSQFQKLCADKNVMQLSLQGTSAFRTIMIKIFMDSVAKEQKTLDTLKSNAYWSERAAESSKQRVDQGNTQQDSFNRDVCEKAGGTYFAGKCI